MRTLLLAACFALAACHKPEPAPPPPTPSVQQVGAERAAEVPESTQRHWTFLNRIRQEDAYSSAINRTMLNDQGQLGVVLYADVPPDKVPAMMQEVLTKMGQKFPGEDATVVVYLTATPPRKIGTAHLDGKTEEATYTSM